MSFIGSLFGGGGAAGSNFNAQAAPITNPVSTEQLNVAKAHTESGLNAAQNLQGQIAGNGGLQNQSNVFGQQQGLANQLQQQANGQGPNPVQAMLAQNTAANTAQQAALMAGQRGLGANAGLIARQAANVGGNNQQQMAGQAATLGAQQQLAAQQALMQQQASMQNVAGNQVGQQLQATQGYNQTAQGLQGNLFNAVNGVNNANAGMASNMNNANGSMAGRNMSAQAGLLGGVGAALGLAQGGQVPGYADGGIASPYANMQPGVSQLSQFLASQQGSIDMGADPSAMNWKPLNFASKPTMVAGGPMDNKGMPMQNDFMTAAQGAQVPGKPNFKGDDKRNDTVPAMLSPGEVVIPNHILQAKNAGDKAKAFVEAILAKNGRLGKK